MINLELINNLFLHYGIELEQNDNCLNVKTLENNEIISSIPMGQNFKEIINYKDYILDTLFVKETDGFRVSLYENSKYQQEIALPEIFVSYSVKNSALRVYFDHFSILLFDYLGCDEMLEENTLAILSITSDTNTAIVQGFENARLVFMNGTEIELTDIQIFENVHANLERFVNKHKNNTSKDYTKVYSALYNISDHMIKNLINTKNSEILNDKKENITLKKI